MALKEQIADRDTPYSIKKPKTYRYRSLRGTDSKFRRNHRYALHGTAKALVFPINDALRHMGHKTNHIHTERSQGRETRNCMMRRYQDLKNDINAHQRSTCLFSIDLQAQEHSSSVIL